MARIKTNRGYIKVSETKKEVRELKKNNLYVPLIHPELGEFSIKRNYILAII